MAKKAFLSETKQKNQRLRKGVVCFFGLLVGSMIRVKQLLSPIILVDVHEIRI